jgi:serine-type D-Ala-D-Ala carboxypeptidase/endopeptidase
MTLWAPNRRVGIATVLLCCLLPSRADTQPPQALDPLAVRAAFIPRTNDGTFHGIAAAWRDGDSIRVATAGATGADGVALLPANRLPLGEVGALFTAALLANLVVRGDVSFDDLAQRFMPSSIRLPTRRGRAITLGDLAFHRSGLPYRSPSGAGAVTERLARAINSRTELTDIGSRYAFSQLGIDLLGAALANHLHTTLETAISSRILHPLGLSEIEFGDGSGAGERVTGHEPAGTARSRASQAAGTHRAWYASVSRLAQFAAAASDTVRGPLASTFALMLRSRSLGADPTLPVALGWRVLRLNGRDIYWHDALDVPGFSAYVAIDPTRSAAAAVLSNTSRPVDAIAGQLLLGRIPSVTAAPPRRVAPPARRRQAPIRTRPRRRR